MQASLRVKTGLGSKETATSVPWRSWVGSAVPMAAGSHRTSLAYLLGKQHRQHVPVVTRGDGRELSETGGKLGRSVWGEGTGPLWAHPFCFSLGNLALAAPKQQLLCLKIDLSLPPQKIKYP